MDLKVPLPIREHTTAIDQGKRKKAFQMAENLSQFSSSDPHNEEVQQDNTVQSHRDYVRHSPPDFEHQRRRNILKKSQRKKFILPPP